MRTIDRCRICGGRDLVEVLSLGEQALTGVFPRSTDEEVSSGPLRLGWCSTCTLCQLLEEYDPNEMYGPDYGYRSGLNESMVMHLKRKFDRLARQVRLQGHSVHLDIGSNDGTLLNYNTISNLRIGVDPIADSLQRFYDPSIVRVNDFFPSNDSRLTNLHSHVDLLTCVAMFYDLIDPLAFVDQIALLLSPRGVAHFEVSYLPTMLRMCAYDSICHEHVEYYSLHVLKSLFERVNLRIADVQLNAVNGGSIAIDVCHKNNQQMPTSPIVSWLLRQEDNLKLDSPEPFRHFEARVYSHRRELRGLVRELKDSGSSIVGYGASTKGNVLLQFAGFTIEEIPIIAERNTMKFGRFTPRTHIPIASEEDVRRMNPDFMLVMPWHFRASIVERENDFLEAGGQLILPLPEIEVF